MCGNAWAQPTTAVSTGLGQAWPNAPDVSSSPRWHVYVFERDGIRFVQVNDLNGTVRGAFATVQGEFLALPIGKDSQYISTPQHQLDVSAQSPVEEVYKDSSIKVLLTPQINGKVQLNAVVLDCTGLDCSGGGRVN
ncbi:hypothetical protein DVJ77_02605 [Dyella tabacisoli]|uniref:Uncharacterized protein n=1 Tax=Dyella tabacisoli TaxID=2282381 RepID=A0A369USN4_9GAMM|nr:hypothetical protein DVJ77_02605 [Dyella tabacisoli]